MSSSVLPSPRPLSGSLLVMEVFRSGRLRYLFYAMGLHYLLNGVGVVMAQQHGIADDTAEYRNAEIDHDPQSVQ